MSTELKSNKALTNWERLTAVFVAFLMIGIALFFHPLKFAQNVNGSEVFPEKDGFIVNLTPSLSRGERNQLNIELENYWKRSGNTFLVLVTNDFGDLDIQQFAHKLFDKWKPGKEKQDNGLILVLSPEKKKSRLEVGYGLEGSVPDVLAKRILDSAGQNYFKKDLYAEGISQIIRSVEAKADLNEVPPSSPDLLKTLKEIGRKTPFVLLVFIFVFATILIPNAWKASWLLYFTVYPFLAVIFGSSIILFGLSSFAAFYWLLVQRKNNLGMGFAPGGTSSAEGLSSWSSSPSHHSSHSYNSGSSDFGSSPSSGDSGGDSGGGGASSDW